METGTHQSLNELVRASARGDTGAFKRLYDATAPQLYALAIKMVQERSVAEDVLQDAFVKVWHRAGEYHADRGSVMTWLMAIVRYRAIDMLRKKREHSLNDGRADVDGDEYAEYAAQMAKESTLEESGGPLSSALAAEGSHHLRECIQRLSKAQVQSVSLAFFHGLTHQELSDCLALPLGTIKSRLRRSLQRLKECLTDLGYLNEISSGTH